MDHKSRRKNDGMALLMALFFIGIAVLVIGILTGRIMQQRKVVARFEDYNHAFLGVEAAISTAMVDLENEGDGVVGMENWKPEWNPDNSFIFPEFDANGVLPQSLNSMDDVQYAAYTVDWTADGRDNNGNGLTDDASENRMYTVYAMAKRGAVVRRAEVIYKGENVSVWENAMFAGPGILGGLLNGNVNVRGSVHMLGDNLLAGVPGLSALGLGGNTTVKNNYAGIPNELEKRIPPAPETIVAGETVRTLGATLRAKGGLLSLTGASTIGEPQTIGNALKETLDGVFVTGGWIGDAVIPDGDRGDPTNVFSDNGWDALYDLADKVVFPLLDGPWLDAQGAAETTNPGTGSAYKHEEYFTEVLVGSADDPNDGMYTGNITLDTQGSHFYWNATTGDQMSGSLPGTAPAKTEDYILFNKDKDVLELNGQIVVDGKLSFKGKGTQKTIYYTGKGAILVTDDVQIDSHLLTCNDGNPNDFANSFPVENALGIMTEKGITFGSGLLDLIFKSDLNVMGAFYAQDKIKSLKKANVAGTVVSNYFELTLNPPQIYQVPSLANNLPEGMVGDYPIMALTQVSWRELGL